MAFIFPMASSAWRWESVFRLKANAICSLFSRFVSSMSRSLRRASCVAFKSTSAFWRRPEVSEATFRFILSTAVFILFKP